MRPCRAQRRPTHSVRVSQHAASLSCVSPQEADGVVAGPRERATSKRGDARETEAGPRGSPYLAVHTACSSPQCISSLRRRFDAYLDVAHQSVMKVDDLTSPGLAVTTVRLLEGAYTLPVVNRRSTNFDAHSHPAASANRRGSRHVFVFHSVNRP